MTQHWALPALTPRLATAATRAAGSPPKVEVDVGAIRVWTENRTRSVALYRERSDRVFVIDRLVPAFIDKITAEKTMRVALPPGRWAISLVDRHGVETRAAPIVTE